MMLCVLVVEIIYKNFNLNIYWHKKLHIVSFYIIKYYTLDVYNICMYNECSYMHKQWNEEENSWKLTLEYFRFNLFLGSLQRYTVTTSINMLTCSCEVVWFFIFFFWYINVVATVYLYIYYLYVYDKGDYFAWNQIYFFMLLLLLVTVGSDLCSSTFKFV